MDKRDGNRLIRSWEGLEGLLSEEGEAAEGEMTWHMVLALCFYQALLQCKAWEKKDPRSLDRVTASAGGQVIHRSQLDPRPSQPVRADEAIHPRSRRATVAAEEGFRFTVSPHPQGKFIKFHYRGYLIQDWQRVAYMLCWLLRDAFHTPPGSMKSCTCAKRGSQPALLVGAGRCEVHTATAVGKRYSERGRMDPPSSCNRRSEKGVQLVQMSSDLRATADTQRGAPDAMLAQFPDLPDPAVELVQAPNPVRDEMPSPPPADRRSGDAAQDRTNHGSIMTTPLLPVRNLAPEIDGAVSGPGPKPMASVNDLLHSSGDQAPKRRRQMHIVGQDDVDVHAAPRWAKLSDGSLMGPRQGNGQTMGLAEREVNVALDCIGPWPTTMGWSGPQRGVVGPLEALDVLGVADASLCERLIWSGGRTMSAPGSDLLTAEAFQYDFSAVQPVPSLPSSQEPGSLAMRHYNDVGAVGGLVGVERGTDVNMATERNMPGLFSTPSTAVSIAGVGDTQVSTRNASLGCEWSPNDGAIRHITLRSLSYHAAQSPSTVDGTPFTPHAYSDPPPWTAFEDRLLAGADIFPDYVQATGDSLPFPSPSHGHMNLQTVSRYCDSSLGGAFDTPATSNMISWTGRNVAGDMLTAALGSGQFARPTSPSISYLDLDGIRNGSEIENGSLTYS